MCSFPSICGAVIDKKGIGERNCQCCSIACLSLSLHSGFVIGAIQLRDLEIRGHVDGSPVCHGINIVHSGSLIGAFPLTQRI